MKQVFMKKNALRAAAVAIEEVPAPRCGPSSVLIANRYSLISAGTETAAVKRNKRDMVVKALRSPELRQSVVDMLVQDGLRKTADRVQFEMTKWTPLGYSGAGVAIEVGRDIEGIQPGDLVAYGGESHAELIRAAKNLCVPVPQGVPLREAAFVAVGSIALQAVRRTEPQVGDVVAVLGLGLVGQLVSQLLQSAGARVVGSDMVAKRLELATSLGLEAAFPAGEDCDRQILRYTGGVGVDRVVICAAGGGADIMRQAAAMTRDRGRICVVGAIGIDAPHHEFYMKELELVMSRSYGPGRYDRQYEEHGRDYPIGYVRWTEQRNMQEFLRQVGAGKVRLEPLITQEFGVEAADEAYQLLMERKADCLGVLLKYDEAAAMQPRRKTPASARPRATTASAGNVAVIGCGSFARQFHLPNLKRSKDLRFRTLVASSGQSAREMADRYGAESCATDVAEVWNDASIDSVMIFTRDKSHAGLTVAALNAGKHVFCEKPLATTIEECEQIAAAAATSGRVCMTGFNRRFAPLLVQAGDVLAQCRGPKLMTYRVNAGPASKDSWIHDPAHGAGRIIGEACHFIDLFRHLTGAEPVRVTAAHLGDPRSADRTEDVSANFEFSDGSVATLLYVTQGSPAVGKERLEVFCDGTSVLLDDYRTLTVRGARTIDAKVKQIDKGHGAELQHFARAVRGEEPPLIDAHDGIIAAVACIRLIESARLGEPLPIEL
ncbi:MAG: bi-domain-containing oxidoreductase [Planctomyces sp.]|nr:bi-domain-containing oxidoreductase [Planctomyces sp.]